MENKINWDLCCISIPEAEVDNVGPLLAEWLADHDEDYIREAAWYGQEMFDQWLHRDKWDELFGIAVMPEAKAISPTKLLATRELLGSKAPSQDSTTLREALTPWLMMG